MRKAHVVGNSGSRMDGGVKWRGVQEDQADQYDITMPLTMILGGLHIS